VGSCNSAETLTARSMLSLSVIRRHLALGIDRESGDRVVSTSQIEVILRPRCSPSVASRVVNEFGSLMARRIH